MQIVIDIDEEDYHRIASGFGQEEDALLLEKIFKNGIPLPKGHGRLIDANKLKTHFVGTEQGTDLEVYLESTIIDALTIVEADKVESEDKK